MDKETLVNYFANSWQGEIEKYKYSGNALIERMANKRVLDVGCGFHYFKDKVSDIYGIDIANPAADMVCDVLDYTTQEPYDVVLCLGSLNFGPANIVYAQTQHVVENLLAPGGTIFWRCNPGLHDHKHAGMEAIDFFEWSFDLHEEWSELLGCSLDVAVWDTDDRIYAEWTKKDVL